MGFANATDNAALRGILAELQAQRQAGRNPFEDLFVEGEQEALLATMVEAERRVPREQNHPFILVRTHGEGCSLIHDGLRDDATIAAGDLRSLAEDGLLRRALGSTGSASYEVTNRGRAFYAWMKQRDGEPLERVEAETRRLIDGSGFRERHPAAHARWSQAEAALWGAETAAQFTDIGHACREAIQLFVTDLVERHGPKEVDPDPQKTVNRLRAVVSKAGLSGSVAEFLEALLAYFGAVSDLAHRQVHGAQKEGTPLAWEDARRLVFQAAMVMFELDRTLG
jgi:hypothetical protein